MHPGPTSRTNQASFNRGGAGLVGGVGRGTAVIRRSGVLVGLKRSDRLREAERSSGFRAANHPRSCRPASSRLLPARIGFIAPLSTALRSRRLPLSPRAGVGAKPAGGDCGEAGETPASIPAFTKHIFVGFCSQVWASDLSPPFALAPAIFFR
jgi:hypothetical protein